MEASDPDVVGEAGDDLIVRRCTAEDVRKIERREPSGRTYASTTFSRQTEGCCT